MILGTLVGFFLGGGLLFQKYRNLSAKGEDGNNFKNLAIFLWILGGIFILFIFCICGQINLAITLIKSGSHFISTTFTTLLVPLI